MLKWTASAQRLHELPSMVGRASQTAQLRQRPLLRRQRRATIANKENIPVMGYTTSTPMLRNSPLVLAPLTDIRNVTPEATPTASTTPRRLSVHHVQYASTLPRYAEEEYSPSTASASLLPTGQHLALRGLLGPLDPFVEQPRYIAASKPLKKRKLEPDFVAVMEEQQPLEKQPIEQREQSKPQSQPQLQLQAVRPTTPQHSLSMGDQTLDKLIDAILDSARKADASSKKKARKSFNLRRRTLVKQQLQTTCQTVLSPSYAPGDDPASDLSFTLLPPMPLPATPTPSSPMQLRRSLLLQMPTPQASAEPQQSAATPILAGHSDIPDNTFTLETPVRPLKRRRENAKKRQTAPSVSTTTRSSESPLKRYKMQTRSYFEVGLALPSIYV
ncbi:uncharacterized protein LOC115629960 [Scaptodrosophila lebanonensis]|uniref:Uncharacterized protein LOC115629960 n=1 Tax=Drosophila lebanonensis TaxID=7225 RepID=A0A6J2U4L0_DROLE|nr:uncharacterized protein LOC115629960 [Scaptodrosophila lebanonensis]